MLDIYLLRHGQTQYNIDEVVQGWNDSPLTDSGIYQAKCTGYGLKDTQFICTYSGDAKRQIKTAQTFLSQNIFGCNIVIDKRFREMCYGKYQDGHYYDMLNQLYERVGAEYNGYDGLYQYYTDIEIATLLYDTDETGTFEGPVRLWKRFKVGLDQITNQYKEGNILISTSSMAICSVVYHLFPEFKQKKLVDNASITILSYDGSYHLSDYNNTEFRKTGEKYFSSL